jgi:hypothetical protein
MVEVKVNHLVVAIQFRLGVNLKVELGKKASIPTR